MLIIFLKRWSFSTCKLNKWIFHVPVWIHLIMFMDSLVRIKSVLKLWLAAVPYFPNRIIFFSLNKLKINFYDFCFPIDQSISVAKKLTTARAAYILLFSVPPNKWGLHSSISTTDSSNILKCWSHGGGGPFWLGMLASGGFAFSLL